MAYEFTKLSDVAVAETPTDNSHVLIEEDGVIKKAPKTAVGGSGEPDAIITLSGRSNVYDACSGAYYTLGGYDSVMNKMNSGIMPLISIEWFYPPVLSISSVTSCIKTTDGFIQVFFKVGNDELTLFLHTDGTIENANVL